MSLTSHGDLEWPMSALGQKRTFALHQLMSALPPIATAKADISWWLSKANTVAAIGHEHEKRQGAQHNQKAHADRSVVA
jgi:hypothetical protein